MIVKKAAIATADIGKIGIYWNTDELYADQVAAKTGATMVIEGAFFEWDGAVCHLKENGVIKAKPDAYTGNRAYSAYGYQWDTGKDINMALVPGGAIMDSHISCTTAIVGGKRQEPLYYNSDVSGYRQRGAMGIKNRQLVFLATPSGVDMESFRDHLYFVEGWESGIILDGGTKVNVYLNGEVIRGAIKPMYYLYVVPAGTPEKEETPVAHKVFIDPGHDADNKWNGNAEAGYLEHQGTWAISSFLQTELTRCGIETQMSRTATSTGNEIADIVNLSNAYNPDLFLSIHTNALGTAGSSARGALCITSAEPDSALRNQAAWSILGCLEEAGIQLFGEELYHNLNYPLIRNTYAPAMYIECGFHTNTEEVELLKNPTYQKTLAVAIAKGVCEHLDVVYVAETPVEPLPPTTNVPSDWAQDAWLWAYQAGLMDGTDPQGGCTREMLATVLYRFAQGNWR